MRRRHRSSQRRELGRRLEIGVRVLLVVLVAAAAAMVVRFFRLTEATIGFDEVNRLSGTLPAIVTIDRDGQVQATATCRSRENAPSDCQVELKLRRGEHFIQIRLKHPDGRWTPDSDPTLVEIR